MGADGDTCDVNISSLAQQLREELAAATSPAVNLTDGCPIIIAEVVSLTRNVDAAEYDPHHVSIGPYHRIKNPDLAKDEEKIRCLNAVLSPAASAGAATALEDYLGEIAGLEARARSCYAHSFSIDSNEFVRMLLLDGCYLLARFGDVVGAERRTNSAAAAAKGGTTVSAAPVAGGGGDMLEAVAVVRDAFYLAENQIPFFVLDRIHQLTVSDRTSSTVDAIAGYVRELLRRQQYSVATPAVAAPPGPGNLLHLLHMHLTSNVPAPRTCSYTATAGKQHPIGRWKTATEYHFAGVRFKSRPVGDGGARSILDVKLDGGGGGALEVPRLCIDAETWRLLRNLMALEQRNPEAAGSHVTAYCVFMSQLACTAADVELLSRRGVISHGLGNHGEVAALFSDLCKGVVFSANDPDFNYLRSVWQELEDGFQCQPRRWMAWLQQTHFSNPWLAVGLAAAVVGLVCTMVQAVYSVLSYRQGTRW